MVDELKITLADTGKIMLHIHVRPNAAKSELVGFLDDGSLKVNIAAPADGGRGNDVLEKFIANLFHVRVTNVQIISGRTARLKLVKVTTPR